MGRVTKIGVVVLILIAIVVSTASAQEVTRSFDKDPVLLGQTVRVTLSAAPGAIGVRVIETYPVGFTFVNWTYSGANNVAFSQSGNTLTFIVTDINADGYTITYTLQAPTTEGTYTFTGTYEAMGLNPANIAGDSVLSVSKINQPPVADFTYSPSSPTVGQAITFDASSSYDPDGSIISYQWNFGDGSTDSGATVTHTYSSAGTYTVTLTVTDNDGLTDSYSTTVTTTTTAKATLKIYSSPSGASVYIDGSYKGTTPLTLYLDPGSYTVRLKKSGYEDYVEDVYLSSGETETLNVHMSETVVTTTAKATTTTTTLEKQSQLNSLYLLFLLLILIVPAVIYRRSRGSSSPSSSSTTPSPPHPPPSSPSQPQPPESSAVPATKDLKPEVRGFPQELLTKYQPLEYLGEGGFARVFKVKRLSDGQTIALKIPNLDKKARKFFLKEVKAWSQLDHPNIVKLFNAFDTPIPHLEMEYVEGVEMDGEVIRDLAEYPKPVTDEIAINLITKVSQGLKHAHSKQIYHRDLKPNNILLKSDLTPKITDWGLAKIGAMTTTATTTKGLTLLYAAPEQLDDEMYGHTDQRTDVYQLGLVLYEMLTGKLPYEGANQAIIMAKIINPDVKPKPPSQHDEKLSKYDNFFEKALAKRKEDRYQSVDEFLDALNEIERLDKERRQLRESIAKTKTTMSVTTSSEELRKLTREVVRQLCKNALINAKLNDKAELVVCLEELKAFSKKHEDELQKLIERVELMIREKIPVGEELISGLKVLFHKIEKEI